MDEGNNQLSCNFIRGESRVFAVGIEEILLFAGYLSLLIHWYSTQGKFLWPGFGENSRVLDWIFQRLEGKENIAQKTPIGYMPTKEGLRTDGLQQNIDFEQLFEIDRDFWKQEVRNDSSLIRILSHYYHYQIILG